MDEAPNPVRRLSTVYGEPETAARFALGSTVKITYASMSFLLTRTVSAGHRRWGMRTFIMVF